MTGVTEQEPSEFDAQQAFMDLFQELFSKAADSITLTNIYKEIPISHPATIREVKGHHLELCTSQLQLAAICRCSEVYIRSPHLDAPVLGRLESIDVRAGMVRLTHFSYTELQEKNRKTIRVRFKKPTGIVIHSGTGSIPGVIHDISLGGCCINTLVREGLGGSDQLRVELKLIEQATGQVSGTLIPCGIVRIYNETPPFKCVLCFHHTKQSEQFLSIFINQRQLEILKELREKL